MSLKGLLKISGFHDLYYHAENSGIGRNNGSKWEQNYHNWFWKVSHNSDMLLKQLSVESKIHF